MQNSLKWLSFLICFVTTHSLAGTTPTITRAQAILTPTQNNHVTGTVTFYQFADGVKVVADVTGLKPGNHGFHIHEWGDCSAADASSAGGHFNPIHESHGAPNNPHHHEGDLGNLVADGNGKAHYEWASKDIHLSGANTILGRSIIVHADADDLHTQPTGNSGGRLACGVIGAINPNPEKG